MHSQIEIERKYDVGDSATIPPLWEIAPVVSAGEALLDAVYFDTEAGDLAANRIVLRRRSGGADEGWHVKLPGDEGRTEMHWPLRTGLTAGDAADSEGGPTDFSVPDEVRAAVRDFVHDHPLAPIATIRTRRTMLHLMDEADAPLLEIADDVVTASDLSTGVVRLWREWETELLAAAPASETERSALLDAVEERLLAAGATPAASVSKLASALGRTSLGGASGGASGNGSEDASGNGSGNGSGNASGNGDREQAENTEPATSASSSPSRRAAPSAHRDLARGSAVGDVLTAVLSDLIDDVERFDVAVRQREHDAVHQLRTRVRRIRSILSSYSAVFDGGLADPIRHELREFAGILGEARDAEVMAQRAQSLLDDHPHVVDPQANGLVTSFAEAHSVAYERVLAALSQDRYSRLLDSLASLAASPPGGETARKPASKVVPDVLAGELARVLRRAKKADAAADDTARVLLLHDTRKAAKRLRYAAEAVSVGSGAVFGRKTRKLAAAAERVHDLLGEHRDSSLMQQHLRDSAQGSGSAFAYGVFFEVERHGAALCLAEYPAALKILKSHR